MALTERAIEEYQVVGDFKEIRVAAVTIIERDGVELTRSIHRHVIMPGDDVSGESADVQALAAQFHTQAVKDAYAAHLAANEPA